ncbi:uncharacterized protein LOC105182851 [Harpegnathos saltator]|uniref:uncharacterized protein LOC105182851 n=1 Tax=Harpegnathos saltator TaxID=610380 RepID=UPI000DBED47C|nr:uncharacterized protein LOC105182851 [Harpegnathos saltator]
MAVYAVTVVLLFSFVTVLSGLPHIISEPLTTTEHHLAVENDKKEKEYLLIGKLKDEDYEVDEINHNDKTKMLKLKSNKKEARNMMEASLNTNSTQNGTQNPVDRIELLAAAAEAVLTGSAAAEGAEALAGMVQTVVGTAVRFAAAGIAAAG